MYKIYNLIKKEKIYLHCQ